MKVVWGEGLRDGGSNPGAAGSGDGIVAVLELGEGAAALPVGVLRELGFGGGGAMALVHGGSGVDRPQAGPNQRIEQRLGGLVGRCA